MSVKYRQVAEELGYKTFTDDSSSIVADMSQIENSLAALLNEISDNFACIVV